MAKLLKIEKALFYFLALAGFWQWRLVWVPAGHQFNEWFSFYLYATDFILAAIFILWVGRWLVRQPKSDFGGAGNIALGLFLFFCALALFVASDKAVAFYRFIKLLEFVGLYFYVRYNFVALYSLKKFWQWFIAGAALQSVVAVAQFLTQKSLGLKFFAESPLAPDLAGVAKIVVDGAKIIRAYGLVPHPNILAAMLIVAIFGLVYLWFRTRPTPTIFPFPREGEKKRGWFVIFLFALFSVALFFTFSRSVIIVGGVLFLLWLTSLWRAAKEYHRPIIFICILLFMVYCLLFIVYFPYVSARYDLTALPENQAVNLRFFYNQAALDFVNASPWLGVGQGNFTVALRQAFSLPDWQYQPAHNIYLLAAAENGWPALLAFLAFLFLTVRSVWLCRKDLSANCLLFIVYCLLLIGLFDHFLWDLQPGQILFWLMLGLVASFKSS